MTDWQKEEVRTKCNTSLGKGALTVVTLFTSRNTVLIDPLLGSVAVLSS